MLPVHKGRSVLRVHTVGAGSPPVSAPIFQCVVVFSRPFLDRLLPVGCSCGCSSKLRKAHGVDRRMQGRLGMVEVAHRRGDRRMTEDLRDGDDIDALMKQSAGTRMAEDMPPRVKNAGLSEAISKPPGDVPHVGRP